VTLEHARPDADYASAKLSSLSIIALAELNGGGGGGDSSAPDIEGFEFSGGTAGYSSVGIGFNNDLEPIVAKTVKPFTIILTIFENYGLQAFRHISLYLNLRGLNYQIHESDTYIRWDKGFSVSVRDPHGYFADADVEVFEVEIKSKLSSNSTLHYNGKI